MVVCSDFQRLAVPLICIFTFEFANMELVRNAKADRLDGATIAFQQLTISCVSCHKMLRDID